MKSCAQLYLNLAPGLELDRAPIPFLAEDQCEPPSPSAAHKGPVEECLQCSHIFFPNPYPDLRRHKKSSQDAGVAGSAGSAAVGKAGGGSAASSTDILADPDAEGWGRLAPLCDIAACCASFCGTPSYRTNPG